MILACLMLVAAYCTPPEQEYIVTIPRVARAFRVCGKNRLDALMGLSPTVWTKEEAAKAKVLFPSDIGDPGQIACGIHVGQHYELRWVYPDPTTGDCPK